VIEAIQISRDRDTQQQSSLLHTTTGLPSTNTFADTPPLTFAVVNQLLLNSKDDQQLVHVQADQTAITPVY
jgi:hypothetical protein